MTTGLTLADLLSRRISIEWFEGVAVVCDVIERLAERHEWSPTVPELHEVSLSSDGRVEIGGRTHADEPVRRLGQLLQAFLIRSELPVQLRLLISKATAPEPGFGSVAEFADALAYFDRPQRQQVLRQLYERAVAAPLGDTDHSPTLDTIAPLVAAPGGSHTGPPRAWNLRPLVWGAAALVVVVAGIAAARYVRGARVSREVGGRVVAVTKHLSTVATDGLFAGVSAVTERIGLGRVVPADAPVAHSNPAAPAPLARRAARRTPASNDAHRASFAAFDLEARVAPAQPGLDAPVRAGNTALAVPPPIVPANTAYVDNVIYSAGSENVTPPVPIRPQLPSELPPTINADDLSRIELVVAPDGSVESVKLLGRVPSVHDMMFLSVAKAWQFQPAVKQGVAVRYRKTVWIVDQ